MKLQNSNQNLINSLSEAGKASTCEGEIIVKEFDQLYSPLIIDLHMYTYQPIYISVAPPFQFNEKLLLNI